MRIYSLKPFKLEQDNDRNYDILRAYLIEKRLTISPNEVPNVINQRVNRVRCDTFAIDKLKLEFPYINHDTVGQFASNYDVKFVFYYRKNSRTDMKEITRIGSGKLVVNIGISGFETFDNISFRKLSLLREMHNLAGPCNYLKSKIRPFHSILDAFRHLKMLEMYEDEFFQEWGTLEIKFNQFKTFAKLFKCGIEIWTDEEKPSRLRTAYLEPKAVILINKTIENKSSIHVHDQIKLVIDPAFLRVYSCENCFKDFYSKFNLARHVKSCVQGTKYTYKEKQYGYDTENIRSRLNQKNVLEKNEPCLYNFVSFDIESLNVPVQESLSCNTTVRFKQEVNIFGSKLIN